MIFFMGYYALERYRPMKAYQEKIGHSGSRYRILKSLSVERKKYVARNYLGEFLRLSEGYRFFIFSDYPLHLLSIINILFIIQLNRISAKRLSSGYTLLLYFFFEQC